MIDWIRDSCTVIATPPLSIRAGSIGSPCLNHQWMVPHWTNGNMFLRPTSSQNLPHPPKQLQSFGHIGERECNTFIRYVRLTVDRAHFNQRSWNKPFCLIKKQGVWAIILDFRELRYGQLTGISYSNPLREICAERDNNDCRSLNSGPFPHLGTSCIAPAHNFWIRLGNARRIWSRF